MKHVIILIILTITFSQDIQSINVTCPSGCVSCTNDTSCDACEKNMQYVASENACISCLTYDCIACQSFLNCTLCNYPKINLFGVCADSQAIDPICAYCNEQLSNFLTFYCYCEECIPGYFENQGSCEACQLYCLYCASAQNCTQCLPGYALDTNSSQCVSCPNVDYCPSACQIGQFYNFNISKCTACLPYCMYCDNTAKCNQCLPGFSLTKFQLCNPCYPGCTNCTNLTQCFSCIPGTTLYQTSDMIICIACPIVCSICQVMNKTLVCLQCQLGSYLKYDSGLQCSYCPFGCAVCSQIMCQFCFLGFHLTNGSCISCSQFLGHQGCYNCSDLSCNSCGLGYFNVNGECIACSSGCAQCLSQNMCIYCLQGYYLEGGSCTFCFISLALCSTCANSSVCTQCFPQFFLNNDSHCDLCPNNCNTCQNSTVCSSCLPNYYLNNYGCFLCPSPCSTCMQGSLCLSCNIGYIYIQSNQSCLACMENCDYCTNSTYCTYCNSNTYLENGSCITYKSIPWPLIVPIIIAVIIIILISLYCYNKLKSKQENKKSRRLIEIISTHQSQQI